MMADPSPTATTDSARPKVVIADKNPVVRAGLKEFITADGRFEVVGTLPTGGAFLLFADDNPADIAIIGWSLPDMTGAEVLSALKRRHGTVRVIVYTGEPGKDVLRQAVRLGAWGFISKSDEPGAGRDASSSS